MSVFDAVFAAVCRPMWKETTKNVASIDASKLEQLKVDPEFVRVTQKATAQTANVSKRLERAKAILAST